MPSNSALLIIGAGHAGGRTAAALRKQGWQERVILIGEEQDPPYERPPLSKEVLSADADPLVGRLYDDDFYRAQEVELQLSTRVVRLEPERRRVVLDGGSALSYDTLVLATGARARALQCPGGQLEGVLTLRTAEDARALRAVLQSGTRLVLIGGGFIGLEVAASAAKRGCAVTVLEAAPHLLARVLPPSLADYVAGLHARHDVRVRCGVTVEAIEGESRVSGVRLADGEVVAADAVVIGIGAVPNVELAAAAGLTCDNGVLTDDKALTSAPGIHAVGDATNHFNRTLGRRLRLESWENAEQQPINAAKAICGHPEPYGGVPWFWTDQHEMNLQLLGLADPDAPLVLRGDPQSDRFCAFQLRDGRIVSAALINSGRERRPVKQLMEAGVVVDPAVLADRDTALRSLMPKS